MRINHHLSEQLLLAYSAGILPEAFNLVIATHISLCDDCRAALAAYDSLGGTLLESSALETSDQTAMRPDALAETLRMIDQPQPVETIIAPRPTGVFPPPLQDYVGGDLDAVHWRPVGGGVKQAILPSSRNASVRLISIPPGASVPDHGHRGIELTLVLQGAFRDEIDRFARGDIEIANEEVEHTPVAEEGQECICLAATDAPLRFNSWLPRIAQPFLRI